MPKRKHSSAGILVKQGDKYLVCRSTDRFYYHNRKEIWGIPKGKIDDGENAIQAAIRETEEETNLSFKESELVSLCQYRANSSKYMFVFQVDVAADRDILAECRCNSLFEGDRPEIDAYKMITKKEWRRVVDNHMREIEGYL